MKQSNILVLDIETLPLEVYVWDLREQSIQIGQIKKDWRIGAWSAKWFEEPVNTIKYYDLRKDPQGSDKPLLKLLWPYLDKADTLITQNGKDFDSKKINARFILNGILPPKPYKHYDTYQLSRIAALTSHSLDYLTNNINTKYKKLSHKKYPGFSLWKECLKGNIDAWNEMKRYNIQDTLSTEELAKNLRAWSPEKFPKFFPLTAKKGGCGVCGYNGLMREGNVRHTKNYIYRQNQCPQCGSWQTGERLNAK